MSHQSVVTHDLRSDRTFPTLVKAAAFNEIRSGSAGTTSGVSYASTKPLELQPPPPHTARRHRPQPTVRMRAAVHRSIRHGTRSAMLARQARAYHASVLPSLLSTTSPEFRAKSDAMDALIAEYEVKVAKARLGGGEKAIQRMISKGKKLPRERYIFLSYTMSISLLKRVQACFTTRPSYSLSRAIAIGCTRRLYRRRAWSRHYNWHRENIWKGMCGSGQRCHSQGWIVLPSHCQLILRIDCKYHIGASHSSRPLGEETPPCARDCA